MIDNILRKVQADCKLNSIYPNVIVCPFRLKHGKTMEDELDNSLSPID